MSSVDNRVVKMVFDNAQFKKGAAETKQSLDDVNKAVDATSKHRGLLDISAGMQRITASASKMSIVTTTALATITNKAVNAGLALAKSITLGPISDGFRLYESELTKLNTIMNATGESQKKVQAALNDLNNYANKTIYSFDDMTTAVTKFTNAGLSLKKSTELAKNFSNMVAYAGGSAQQASAGMYALTQMMQLGYIQLQDFKQFDNAGLATVKFKQTLIDAAVAQGELTKKGKDYVTKSGTAFNATKNFNNSLQKQWATTQVLDTALSKYNQHAGKMGRDAFASAQKVRTLTAFMSTLKEAMATGWSRVFRNLIGNLQQATNFWTNLSNSTQNTMNKFFKFMDVSLHVWRTMGGFKKTMEGFHHILAPIGALFTVLGRAWKEAFPPNGTGAGSTLYAMSSGFERMTRPLETLAQWILKAGPALAAFFTFVKMGAHSLSDAAHYVENLVKSLTGLIHMHGPSSGGISSLFDKILGGISGVFKIGVNAAKSFLEGLVAGFKGGSFDTVSNIVGAGLLGAIFLTIRKLMKHGLALDLTGGVFENINKSFQNLTGTLKALQTQIQAKTLMEIAGAIALITASVTVLSFINPGKLSKALTALAAGFSELLGAMAVLTKISGSAGFVKVPLIAASMVLLSASIFILVGALGAMSLLPWDKIGKGLAGIGASLVVIAVGMKLMPTSLPLTATGLVLVSVALNAIAGAIAIMSLLSWKDIGKGLATIAGSLVTIALGMKLMPLSMPVTAAGLVLVGIALNAIGTAIKIMSTMSWEEIGKGLTTLGGAMAILAIGLNVMSGTLLGSAAMMIAAAAIAVLVPSLMLMSHLSWTEIAKGLTALAGSMIILGLAMYAMSGAIVGAAALLIIAPALLALSTALVALGQLSWGQLAVALVGLAAGLTVIGVAGLLIGPVVPALLGLGAALLLLGAGLALAGAGIFLFSAGLTLLVGLGAGAIAYLSKYIGAFISLLPALGAGFGMFLASLAKTLGDNAQTFVDAFVQMFSAVLDQANKLLPKLGKFIGNAIKAAISVAKKYVPMMATAGADIVIGFLNAVSKKLNAIISAGTNLIIKFIEGVGRADARITRAAADTIIKFINSLADTIRTDGPQLGDAMSNLGIAMIQGLIGGIGAMFQNAMDAISGLAQGMVNKAKSILKIFSPSRIFADIGKFLVLGLTNGIQNNAASAITAVASMVGGQIAVANEYISRFIQTLDQQALAARAKADGLAAAANKAAAAASKTKTKKDDQAATKLQNEANVASKQADAAEAKAQSAKDAQDRQAKFASASSLERAQMRSEDAQNQLDAAKAAEARAARDLAEANALDKQSHAAGVTSKQRTEMQKEADALRAQAKIDAANANAQLANAKKSTADALMYQKKAGDEAAAAFEAQYKADAQAAADQAAFEKLSDADKAAMRTKQAEVMQKKADADLAAAKKLAYTDLQAANSLAQQAMDEANQARQFLTDAANYAASVNVSTSGATSAGVVNLKSTDAAAISMANYSKLYDAATAAAAATKTVEFNQYNTSPEALSPTEIYRNTNNQLTFAAEKLANAA